MMSKLRPWGLALVAALLTSTLSGLTTARAEEATVLELRVYTCEADKLDALNTRFRDHTLRIFEKHGMKNVAYWVPTDGETAKTTLIYIIEHKSRDAAKASWDAFRADPEWKKVAADSAEAHGKILAKAPDATYMVPTDYSAKIGPVSQEKVYELRTYTAAEGKLDALHARFRDHTDKIFQRHGMKTIGYWVPQDEPGSKNLLIYVVEHASREAAAESWKAFGADPEWKKARAESEADGSLLAKRPESVFMKATDYSPKAK
ncbi:MAG: NIPSNAP family protein [Planctomycetaceae bacterium]